MLLPARLPISQRQAARRSAGCSFIQSASCGAPIMQDCIETSAKSEVVTVCSWQLAGEERLQSTAMILITIEQPHRWVEHRRRQALDRPAPWPAPRWLDRPAGKRG